MDTRIGHEFLKAGPGFGGSCFEKDILNLVYLCGFYKLDAVANYWQGVVDINNWQKSRISKLIVDYLFGNVSGKKITILGFAFKANTNDTRQSPSIQICRDLLLEGAEISIYDPKVEEDKIETDLKFISCQVDAKWSRKESIEEASKDSDAIVVLTDWQEFYSINWDFIYTIMRKPAWVFDTRSCINYEKAKKAGFNLWKLGKAMENNLNFNEKLQMVNVLKFKFFRIKIFNKILTRFIFYGVFKYYFYKSYFASPFVFSANNNCCISKSNI